jgi:GH25 family lysozyme M1 (1,4-beta-N-acetylmuramidase)
MDRIAVDLYAGDGDFDVTSLCGWDRLALVMLKATQGNYYRNTAWFGRKWTAIGASDRCGDDVFRTPYHYFDLRVDAVAQADFHFDEVDRAGGWKAPGLIAPVVDVERGGQRVTPTRQLVVDGLSRYVERLKGHTGRTPIMYGGELLRALGVKAADVGMEHAWVACYEATLPTRVWSPIVPDVAHLFAWQGVGANGDGTIEGKWGGGYPLTTPAGNADISAITVDGGGDAAVRWMRTSATQGA